MPRNLLAAYKRRSRSIVVVAPAWVSGDILSANECMSDKWVVLQTNEH